MEASIRFVQDVAIGRHSLSKLIPPILWLADAVLCVLVIAKIPYTEIDWVAYMQQVKAFAAGERDYTRISGDTGPLVYPAAHVYIYSGLYHLTDHGTNILRAQGLFAGLYLATLALAMKCYRQARAPPYLLVLLVASKRMHSLFMLRCFNDGAAVFFLWLCIFFLQRRLWTFAAVAYTLGLGVKMTLLLPLPALAVILFLGRGMHGSLRLAWLMLQVQLLLGLPFLTTHPWSYLGRAFEFTRKFHYQWTVNMRVLSESVFQSTALSVGLLIGHVLDLSSLILFRWLEPAGGWASVVSSFLTSLRQHRGWSFPSPFSPEQERAISLRITPRYVLATMLSSMITGLLFARSLHYQFYAYLGWATPFVLWNAGYPFSAVVLVWFVQEYAWNVFPSTPFSSSLVLLTLALADRAGWRSQASLPAGQPTPRRPGDVSESRAEDAKSKKQ